MPFIIIMQYRQKLVCMHKLGLGLLCKIESLCYSFMPAIKVTLLPTVPEYHTSQPFKIKRRDKIGENVGF